MTIRQKLDELGPLFIFSSLFLLYTIYDYFEHVLRPDSTFEEHPFYWLLFNACAFLSFLLIVLSVKKLLEKLSGKKTVWIEAVAFMIWVISYMAILGPIIDRLTWPFDELLFQFSWPLVLIFTGLFIVVRIVFNLILRKPLMFSK